MSGFTPGPWKSAPLGGAIEGGHENARKQIGLACLHYTMDEGEREANQALMTAAPDLYEALRFTAQTIVAYLNDAGASIDDLSACVGTMNAALAKAAPEQSEE